MNAIVKPAKGIGKVLLALVFGIFMPVLIWVALGVAINHKIAAHKLVPAADADMATDPTPVDNKKQQSR